MSCQVVIVSALLLVTVATPQEQAVSAPSNLTCEEIEKFLREANILSSKRNPIGNTRPSRATLEDSRMQHDAAVQTIHENRPWIETAQGRELGYKDWWEFNVAAYELSKMLELNMLPPYVERKMQGGPASISWWISDSMIELVRIQKKLQPPDLEDWDKQSQMIVVFYELVANASRHLTDFLIDKDWRLWMVDFSQSFRLAKDISNKKALVRCERKLLANLRKMNQPELQQRLGRYLNRQEIDALLARRDKIVTLFAEEIARKGEAAVLFDHPRVGQHCGVGL